MSPANVCRRLTEHIRRFGAGALLGTLAYKLAHRLAGVTIGRLYLLDELTKLPLDSGEPELTYRFLSAADIRRLADPAVNDLDPSFAERLVDNRHICFAALADGQLVNYAWYALESPPSSDSLNAQLTLPVGTAYLYKAFTHVDYRGRRIHQTALYAAAHVLASQRYTQLTAIVEFDNWASVRSHVRLGMRQVGWFLAVGRDALPRVWASRPLSALGIEVRQATLQPRPVALPTAPLPVEAAFSDEFHDAELVAAAASR
ncbi:MAG: GNAT family N-acetyltransferase [Planctomycetes bacterium]|nr:GNAT family N-acetyltransferase [Planctomycetota bacterium]